MLLEVSPEAKVAYVRGCNLFTRRRTNPIEDVAEDMSTSPGNIQLLQFSNAAAPIALVGPADDKVSGLEKSVVTCCRSINPSSLEDEMVDDLVPDKMYFLENVQDQKEIFSLLCQSLTPS